MPPERGWKGKNLMEENAKPKVNESEEQVSSGIYEPSMSPQELEALIHRKGIVGQDQAVKTASLIVYRHFVQGCASVNLFCGPTGSGKTEIWRVLAREIPYITIFDSSNLSNEGWSGSNKISYHFRALPPACREKAILVMDEFDKLLEPKQSGDMNVTENIQNELLKLFDHDTLFFGPERSKDEALAVDCRNVSIVLLGAFENLMKAKAKAPVAVGFGSVQKQVTDYGTTEITLEDLLEHTLIRPEIAGRIDRIVSMKPLDAQAYFRILAKYVDQLYERSGSLFTIDLAVLARIARQAAKQRLGARWAIHQVDKIADDLVYREPFEYSYFYYDDSIRKGGQT